MTTEIFSTQPNTDKSNFCFSLNLSGHWVLQDPDSKERMHPLGEPLKESEAIYCSPCRIRERLSLEKNEPLVVWDVGLGMGSNAMACILATQELASQGLQKRKLEMYSFEKFPEGFRDAMKEPEKFPHLTHTACKAFAENSNYSDQNVVWKLVEGDFFQSLEEAPAPEVIFYDPFSQKVNPEFWTPEAFQKLFAKCQGRPTLLATYAVARNIRDAMKTSQWEIAKGPGFGVRKKSTLAMNQTEKSLGFAYNEWV